MHSHALESRQGGFSQELGVCLPFDPLTVKEKSERETESFISHTRNAGWQQPSPAEARHMAHGDSTAGSVMAAAACGPGSCLALASGSDLHPLPGTRHLLRGGKTEELSSGDLSLLNPVRKLPSALPQAAPASLPVKFWKQQRHHQKTQLQTTKGLPVTSSSHEQCLSPLL